MLCIIFGGLLHLMLDKPKRYPKVSKGIQRYPKVSKGIQRYPKVSKGIHRYSKYANAC